jgi:signal peptidase II
MLRWLWLSGVVIILDQLSKVLADRFLSMHSVQTVIPGFFDLVLAYNQGAAFSFLSNAGGWQRWFFTALAIGVSIFLLLWIKRLPPTEKLTAIALSLILGGAIGNLIDRIMYGHVIDFIHWFYKDFSWPAFNLADSAITLGAALLIIHAIFFDQKQPVSDNE